MGKRLFLLAIFVFYRFKESNKSRIVGAESIKISSCDHLNAFLLFLLFCSGISPFFYFYFYILWRNIAFFEFLDPTLYC